MPSAIYSEITVEIVFNLTSKIGTSHKRMW